MSRPAESWSPKYHEVIFDRTFFIHIVFYLKNFNCDFNLKKKADSYFL